MEIVKNEDLESVNGGAIPVPQFEQPMCDICGAPAAWFTIRFNDVSGVSKMIKGKFCQNCVDNEIKQIELAGGKITDVSAVL